MKVYDVEKLCRFCIVGIIPSHRNSSTKVIFLIISFGNNTIPSSFLFIPPSFILLWHFLFFVFLFIFDLIFWLSFFLLKQDLAVKKFHQIGSIVIFVRNALCFRVYLLLRWLIFFFFFWVSDVFIYFTAYLFLKSLTDRSEYVYCYLEDVRVVSIG